MWSGGDGNETTVIEMATIFVFDNQFDPRTVQVDTETEVIWNNKDTTIHEGSNTNENHTTPSGWS